MTEYLEIAYFISKDLISKNSTTEIYEKIAVTSDAFIKCDLVTIFIIGEDAETLQCVNFYKDGHFIEKDSRIMLGEGIIGSVAENGESLVSKDLKTDLSGIYYELEKQFSGMRSILSVPIYAGSLVVGVLNLYAETPYEFTEEEIGAAKFIALMGGVFIYSLTLYENANFLYLKEKEESGKVENLLKVSKLVSSSLDIDSILDNSTKSLMDFTETDMSLVYFKDESQIGHCYDFFKCEMKGCPIFAGVMNCYALTNFECMFTKCPSEGEILHKCVACAYLRDINMKLFKSYGRDDNKNAPHSFKLKECSCLQNLDTGYPSVIYPEHDKDDIGNSLFKGVRKQTIIAIPIKTDKDLLGIIFLFSDKEISYSVDTIDFTSNLSDIISVAVSNAMMLNYVEEAHFDAISSISEAIEARDAYTRKHGDRLINYGAEVAKSLGLDEKEVKNIRYAAALHDVGKIGIKDSILNKPSKLTDEEYEEMKKHPEIGYNMLKKIKFLIPIANEVLHHQERFDGKGYPDKLAGNDIPIVSRIIAVIDTFDAMTTDRPYRKALPVQSALDELRKYSGTQFDPKVVDAFLNVVSKDVN